MKRKIIGAVSVFVLLCTCMVTSVTTIAAAGEITLNDKEFQVNAQVFDSGQKLVSVSFDVGEKVDVSSIKARQSVGTPGGMNFETMTPYDDVAGTSGTFRIMATGTLPNGVVEPMPLTTYNNVEVDIVDVKVENDGTTLVLELDTSFVSTSTLSYGLTTARNIDLDITYTLEQLEDFVLEDGTTVKAVGSSYTMKGIVDPEVDSFTAGTSTSGMNYQLYTPTESAGVSHPLVIWFHGNGEGGLDNYQNNTSQLLANRGALAFANDHQKALDYPYVLAPQVDDTWYNNYSKDYIGKATAMVEEIVEQYPDIDPNRIYIVGGSAGGYMTVHMLINNPDLFAAAIPACAALDVAVNESKGNYGQITTEEEILSLKDIPIWFIHSSDDTVVSSSATSAWMYGLLKDYDNKIYTEYSNIVGTYNAASEHASWELLANNVPTSDGVSLIEWLSQQKKEADAPILVKPSEEKEEIMIAPATGDTMMGNSLLLMAIGSLGLLVILTFKRNYSK